MRIKMALYVESHAKKCHVPQSLAQKPTEDNHDAIRFIVNDTNAVATQVHHNAYVERRFQAHCCFLIISAQAKISIGRAQYCIERAAIFAILEKRLSFRCGCLCVEWRLVVICVKSLDDSSRHNITATHLQHIKLPAHGAPNASGCALCACNRNCMKIF